MCDWVVEATGLKIAGVMVGGRRIPVSRFLVAWSSGKCEIKLIFIAAYRVMP